MGSARDAAIDFYMQRFFFPFIKQILHFKPRVLSDYTPLRDIFTPRSECRGGITGQERAWPPSSTQRPFKGDVGVQSCLECATSVYL